MTEVTGFKLGWKIFSTIIAAILLVVLNLVTLAILAPALVSASSTLAVVCGFALVAFVLTADVAAGVVLFKNLSNKLKDNS